MVDDNRVKINKQILMWAIEESKIDFEEIGHKFIDIDLWINQDKRPTFRQLEELARYLKVPFGYMFLDEPPQTDLIQSEFRTIGNKVPQISKELKDTIYNISRKKDWLSDYRRENGWEKLIPDNLVKLGERDVDTICRASRDYLDLNEYWYKDHQDNISAFKYLRKKIEKCGITVMQNGIVGSNTHRKLDVSEFRGFLLYDDIAPFIFINSNDSVTGKIFTLIHEYIHFLLEEDNIFIDKDFRSPYAMERKINNISAELLMPTSHVKTLWDAKALKIDQITKLSKLFHVSEIAFAIKLKNMNIIGQELFEEVRQLTTERLEKSQKKLNGGNYYNNSVSRLGDSFIHVVIEGTEAGHASYAQAFRLLDNSIKTYDYFKEEFINYGG